MKRTDIAYGILDAFVIFGYAWVGFGVATAGTTAEFILIGTTFILYALARYWMYFNADAPPLPWDTESWKEYNDEREVRE